MMIADSTPEPVTLADIMVSAARRADQTQLFAMLCVGLGGALLVEQAFGRVGWFGAAAALTVGAYGGWGLADRKLNALWSTPGSDRRVISVLQLVRAVAAIVATLSGVAVLSSVFVPALGLWKS